MLPKYEPHNPEEQQKLRDLLSINKPARPKSFNFYLQKAAAENKSSAGEWKSVPGLPSLNEDLSNEEDNRRRYRPSESFQNLFTFLGPRWSRGFGLYWQVMPKEVREDFDSWFYPALTNVECAEQLLYALKNVTEDAKVGGKRWADTWEWFINMETLGGYFWDVDPSMFEETTRQWVEGNVVHESPDANGVLSESQFLDDLEEGMAAFLEKAPSTAKATERFERDFSKWLRSTWHWGGTGSTTLKENVVGIYDGKDVVKAKKTKWIPALFSDLSKLEQDCLDKNKAYGINKVIQKRETAKVRGVVNSDDLTYLRMSWISSWIDAAMQNHPDTALYMSSNQKNQLWEDMRLMAEKKVGWKVPLDQSHFDWQQNKAMLARAMKVIRSWMIKYDLGEQVLEVLDLIEEGLTGDKSYVEVPQGKGKPNKKIFISKGIMSGWRWTAFLDTLFNAGEFFAVVQALKRLNVEPNVMRSNFQGDDVRLVVQDVIDAFNILLMYSIMFFEVNPSKTWVDKGRDEFLRRVAQGGLIRGYPARAINSLLWRNPIKNEPPKGRERVSELASNWWVLFQRGCDEKLVMKALVDDVFRANKELFLTKDRLQQYLFTPAALGGAGFPTNLDLIGRTALRLHPSLSFSLVTLSEQTFSGLIVINEQLERKGEQLMTKEEEQKYALDRLYFYSSPPKIKLGELTDFKITQKTFSKEKLFQNLNYSNFPLTAPINPTKDLGPPALEVIIVRALKQKTYHEIDDLLMQGRDFISGTEWKLISKKVRQYGGIAFWRDWVNGGLEVRIPFGRNQSREILAYKMKRYASSVLAALVKGSSKWEYNQWRGLLANYEVGTLRNDQEFTGVLD